MFLEKNLTAFLGAFANLLKDKILNWYMYSNPFLKYFISSYPHSNLGYDVPRLGIFCQSFLDIFPSSVRTDGDRPHFHISPEVFDWIC